MFVPADRFVKWSEARLRSARSTFDWSARVVLCDDINAATEAQAIRAHGCHRAVPSGLTAAGS